MTDDAAIRLCLFERDRDTDARSIVDIRETAVPRGLDARSWTHLTREADDARRNLLLDLSRQIDELVAGRIDEITISHC